MSAVFALIGLPATGKYTVAKQIAAQLESRGQTVRVVDNHYANNVIFDLVGADGVTPLPREVWQKIGSVRDTILDTIETLSPPDWTFVLTLHASSGDEPWLERVEALAVVRGSAFIPVRLTCDLEELERRVVSPDRIERMKMVSVEGVRQAFRDQPTIPVTHPNAVELDLTVLPAAEAARRIIEHADAASNT